MKEEQDKLEKQLWEERENIRRSHEEKVKVAKDKYANQSSIFLFSYRSSFRAKMIGVGLSKQEAQVNTFYVVNPSVFCLRAES